MRKSLFPVCCTVLCLWSVPGFGFVQKDTLQPAKEKLLDPVMVTGFAPEKYMAGLKINPADTALRAGYTLLTLADFLFFQPSVVFKTYGPGQVTSIGLRGTSPNHTAVLWNGVNINSPSAGQTDFSAVPVAGFDKMSIQYGASAPGIGSDAVGGSILLASDPGWNQKGFGLTSGTRYDSFDNYGGHAGLRWGKKSRHGIQWRGRTTIYGTRMQNHYRSLSRSAGTGEVYPTEPSEATQAGLMQDLYRMDKKGNTSSLNAWISHHRFTLQPAQPTLREILQTEACRILLGQQWGNTELKAGFIRDITDFGRGDFLHPSHTRTDRLLIRAEHILSFRSRVFGQTDLKAGAEASHYMAFVDGYGNGRVRENRGEVYTLWRQAFTGKLVTSVHLRQSLSSHYRAPFAPSAGIEWAGLQNQKDRLVWRANVGRSFRLPTLNERYWEVMGNPDIQPELGFSKETGLNWKHRFSDHFQAETDLNVYHNLINNWTYWNPDKGYRVENLQQVLIKGIEATLSLSFKRERTNFRLGLNYSLNHSSQQKVYDAYAAEVIGKQMVYIPLHQFTGNFTAGYQGWALHLLATLCSERFVTFDHSGRPFPPYGLADVHLSKQWKHINVSLQIRNLTDTVYPTVRKTAMPERSYGVGFTFNF